MNKDVGIFGKNCECTTTRSILKRIKENQTKILDGIRISQEQRRGFAWLCMDTSFLPSFVVFFSSFDVFLTTFLTNIL